MRRALALTIASAALLAPLAGAAHADVECYGVDAGATHAGVCAGVVCVDLCGPTVIVDPYCYQDHGPYLETCNVVDALSYRSRG